MTRPPDEPRWPWLGGEAPRYDTDLTSKEVLGLTGHDRKLRVGLALDRKLYFAALGAFLLTGRGRARLRALSVPALGAWSWGDQRADRDDGPHADALARLDALALELGGGPDLAAEVARLRADVAGKEREVQALTLQVARLSAELARRGPSLDDVRR